MAIAARSITASPSSTTPNHIAPTRQTRKRRSSSPTPARPSRIAVMARAATTKP